MIRDNFDIVVVGGGFFGSSVALHFAERGQSVLLVEKEDSLMKRASFNNQARVHGGYHYPRSILSGLRSQQNYGIFRRRFRNCIDDSFKKYYAVARKFSNVSATQFSLFCHRIGAPIRDAPKQVSTLFDSSLIERVFEVEECAFDAALLAEETTRAIKEARVLTLFNAEAVSVDEDLIIKIHSHTEINVKADQVFLCAYADTNRVLFASALPQISLRQELAEIALVNPPVGLGGAGVTIMCGPFFSLMPNPARGLYSFSHVRYTPHFSWSEGDADGEPPAVARSGETHFKLMLNDARRYLPLLKTTAYVDSIWEVKTLLPRNEGDDARPILFKRNHGIKGLHCVIGGKIDNVFDVIKQIEETE